jgi:hypothetical protein
LHWGGPGGGEIQAFYIGGDTGNQTFYAPIEDGHQHGLSWFDGFDKITPIPEPTTLAAGVCALGLLLASFTPRSKRLKLVRTGE